MSSHARRSLGYGDASKASVGAKYGNNLLVNPYPIDLLDNSVLICSTMEVYGLVIHRNRLRTLKP